MSNRFAFIAGPAGPWRVLSIDPVQGASLPAASRLAVRSANGIAPANEQADHPVWTLQGLMSNLRYATRGEVTALRSAQEGLGRPHASRAAFIPIRKSQAWWDLAQDERRAIFEEQSQHTAIGLKFLPAIARQLYHSRDLAEPFDFLTWFEYAPEHAAAFEDLLGQLRASLEWTFVEREVDIRLERAG